MKRLLLALASLCLLHRAAGFIRVFGWAWPCPVTLTVLCCLALLCPAWDAGAWAAPTGFTLNILWNFAERALPMRIARSLRSWVQTREQ